MANSPQKPDGKTWSEYFDMLAEKSLDSTPAHFMVDETVMDRNKMIMGLALHVNSMQTKCANEQKILQHAAKRQQCCINACERGQRNEQRGKLRSWFQVQPERTGSMLPRFLVVWGSKPSLT